MSFSADTAPTAPRLYRDLAPWFPLLTPPEDYIEEAGRLRAIFQRFGVPESASVLELGCGGGHNAWKRRVIGAVTVSLSAERNRA